MNPQCQQAFADLVTLQITDEEFLQRCGIRRTQAASFSLKLLTEAKRNHDADGISHGLVVGFRFGFTSEHFPVLCELSDEDWHKSHEDVVSALDELRDPRATDVLYRAALKRHPYLEYDEARALAVKALWALGNLRDPAADAKLRLLTQSDEPIVKSEALHQLRRRSAAT